MNIVCIGGGPAGLYFALLMKKQDPAHDITVVERNRPVRHLRLGRGVLRPDAGQPAARPTRRRPARSWARSTTGTTSRSTSRAADPLRRPRLLRHRAQAPAQHPAAALRGARRQAGVRDRRAATTRSIPTPTSSSPATASTAASAPSTPPPTSPTSTCASAASSGWARTSCSRRSPSPSRRPSTAGSRRTPTSSTATPRPSSSRRRRRSGEAPAWTGMEQGGVDRLLRAPVRRSTSTATS